MQQPNQDLSILVVEDDLAFRTEIVKLLGVYNDVFEANSLSDARKLLQKREFDLVLLDKKLPDGNGTELIPEIKSTSYDSVIIIITGDSNLSAVKKCIDQGASDYMFKSSNVASDLLLRIPQAIKNTSIHKRSKQLEAKLNSSFRYELIGCSGATADLRTTVQTLKGTLSPILITGETGTSKELIARRLNAIEEKSRGFVAINCGAIPENLVESELFGHVKGAFSGATENQIGRFEIANGGDLFLDEVGELPLSVQAKLLRVLQEGEITPIGAKYPKQIAVRIIAATNQPLELLMSQKTFRSDLYYRLNVFRINTTPLRDRPEDIPDLAQYFVTQIAGPKYSISEEAIKYLSKQAWPGNIRELRNTIERAYLLARAKELHIIEKKEVTFRNAVGNIPNSEWHLPKSLSDLNSEHYSNFISKVERDYISNAIQLCSGNTLEAARCLGIGRSTLFRKMNDLGITKIANLRPIQPSERDYI